MYFIYYIIYCNMLILLCIILLFNFQIGEFVYYKTLPKWLKAKMSLCPYAIPPLFL